jgi:RTX calcium-binding nonapeptide repeat (4 copies)
MRPSTPLLAITALLLVAPPAGAATVTRNAYLGLTDLAYTAGPGEANRLTITEQSALTILEDPGATILVTPSASLLGQGRCTRITPHRVVCNEQYSFIGVSLGDRDDTASVHGPVHTGLGGGAGNDRLTGGPEGDSLGGGPGTDELIGGAGHDHVSWYGTLEPVRVTLDGQANDGAAGENDFVHGDIEGATGGEGADVLVGDAQANSLVGSAGDDSIEAGAGEDQVDSGAGSDLMVGGPGRDRLSNSTGQDDIRARDGEQDTITCAPGDLLDVDPFDSLTPSCSL